MSVPLTMSREEGEVLKAMELDSSPSSLLRHFTCAKFFVCILSIGLSVRLLLFSSSVISPFGDLAAMHSGIAMSSPVFNSFRQTPIEVINQVTQREKCDLFNGEWVPHPSGPAYTNQSCFLIETHQNCMLNGRPDRGYLYWRWKPKGCDLPLFDAERFLNGMRNKWWAFIGDSITGNHFRSLLCLLSQVEKPIDVFHDKEWQSWRWLFPSFNFTLSVIWSPVLVKMENFDEIKRDWSQDVQLHLDVLHEEWTSQLNDFDYVIISGGKWFLRTIIFYENNQIVGCHYCAGMNLTELGYDYGYRKVLDLVLGYITSSDFKGKVLFRTYSPDHVENGSSCKRTQPFKDGEVTLNEVDKVMKEVERKAFEQAVIQAKISGVDLRLLDTTYLSLLRPDGHPGPYRTFQPYAKDAKTNVENDCLHWCLPGPIDYWNDLLTVMSLDHAHWL